MDVVDKIGVVYWSNKQSTEIMAQKISKGIDETGNTAVLINGVDFDIRNIEKFNKMVLGCPAMAAETLEESTFEPSFRKIAKHLKGKKVALFGSYGWGEREWMFNWENRVKESDAILFDRGMIILGVPDKTGNYWCVEFGKAFAKF